MAVNVQDWYTTQKWYKFRREVFKRDEYKCQDCNSTQDLRVHHIKRATVRPDLFFDEENCVTLCNDCHESTHQKAQSKYIYDKDGFWGYNPSDLVLCDCGRFYHEAKYKMCYECYLQRKKQ